MSPPEPYEALSQPGRLSATLEDLSSRLKVLEDRERGIERLESRLRELEFKAKLDATKPAAEPHGTAVPPAQLSATDTYESLDAGNRSVVVDLLASKRLLALGHEPSMGERFDVYNQARKDLESGLSTVAGVLA